MTTTLKLKNLEPGEASQEHLLGASHVAQLEALVLQTVQAVLPEQTYMVRVRVEVEYHVAMPTPPPFDKAEFKMWKIAISDIGRWPVVQREYKFTPVEVQITQVPSELIVPPNIDVTTTGENKEMS